MAESLRTRAEEAARIRLKSVKDRTLLTTEAIDDLCKLVDRDANRRRVAVRKLHSAMACADVGTIRRLIDEALEELRE